MGSPPRPSAAQLRGALREADSGMMDNTRTIKGRTVGRLWYHGTSLERLGEYTGDYESSEWKLHAGCRLTDSPRAAWHWATKSGRDNPAIITVRVSDGALWADVVNAESVNLDQGHESIRKQLRLFTNSVIVPDQVDGIEVLSMVLFDEDVAADCEVIDREVCPWDFIGAVTDRVEDLDRGRTLTDILYEIGQ